MPTLRSQFPFLTPCTKGRAAWRFPGLFLAWAVWLRLSSLQGLWEERCPPES